jgi:hypothetical protein
MAVLNHEGDTTVEWDPQNEAEVAAARGMWEQLVGRKRYSAFELDEDDERGGRVHSFDPALGRVVLVPPMQGG